ncbi:MAG: F0F1 ATP synthase subunit delta [Lysobacterales bacterium]
MSFDWTTFGFQIANVLLLLAILHHLLFKPIAAIVARRQAETAQALEAAQAARAESEQAAAAAQAEAERTTAARHELLAAVRADSESHTRALLDAARLDATKIVAEARAKAAQTIEQAEAQTLARARDLAETMARRALAALPQPPTPAGYGERLLQALKAMPDQNRKALLAGGKLQLLSPQPLAEAELAALRELLAPLGAADWSVQTDPELIAGLELRSGSGVVHNSLAHDLQTLADAMKHAE